MQIIYCNNPPAHTLLQDPQAGLPTHVPPHPLVKNQEEIHCEMIIIQSNSGNLLVTR